MAKGKMGRCYTRKNSQHRTGEALEHVWIRIEDEDGGNERWAQFSALAIERAVESANKNIEDAPPVSAFRDMLD